MSTVLMALIAPGCQPSPAASPVQPKSTKDACDLATARAFITAPAFLPGDERECQQRCDAGEKDSCVTLGLIHEASDNAIDGRERAFSIYERTCSEGHTAACTHMAYLLGEGLGVFRDKRRATTIIEQTCSGGDAYACFVLGEWLKRSFPIAKDPERAKDLLRKACRGDDVNGCTALASMNQVHQPGSNGKAPSPNSASTEDDALAAATLQKLCRNGSAPSCTVLAEMYAFGTLGEENKGKASKMWEDACAARYAWSCTFLGARLLHGNGVSPDRDRAILLLHQACVAGVNPACVSLHENVSDALSLHDKGCSAGSMNDCLWHGKLQEDGVESPTKDVSSAAKSYDKACAGGIAEACALRAHLYLATKDSTVAATTATHLLKQACSAGHAGACDVLGERLDGKERDDALRRACIGGLAGACVRLAYYAYSNSNAKNPSTDVDHLLALGLREFGCDHGEIAGCVSAAAMYDHPSSRDGIYDDPPKSAEFLEKACDGGHIKSCVNLGSMFFMGRGVPEDREKMLKLERRACQAGDMLACQNLEEFTTNDDDLRMTVKVLETKCAGPPTMDGTGGPPAWVVCTPLARQYLEGRGVQRNVTKAVWADERACTIGLEQSCMRLGELYHAGIDVPKNMSKAAQHFEKACEFGSGQGCVRRAQMYAQGVIGRRDDVAAADLYKRACTMLGWRDGCILWGVSHELGCGVSKDEGAAFKIYEDACKGGSVSACGHQGRMLAAGRGVALDTGKAIEIFESAARSGDAASIVHLDRMHNRGWLAPNELRAMLEDLCKKDSRIGARGCYGLGQAYFYGALKISKDYAEASKLFDKACRGKIMRGCTALGYMHQYGTGLRQDFDEARRLYRRACSPRQYLPVSDGDVDSDQKACIALSWMEGANPKFQKPLDLCTSRVDPVLIGK